MVKKRQTYLNNPNLPATDSEFEYTPEMVKDITKCSLNILFFAESFFNIVSLDEGKQTIDLHLCQKRVLRKMRDNRFFILLASRQIGKTTLFTIYALWVACFEKDQSILIVANKEGTAIEIFRRIRMAYEELPNWLKPGVKEYGKTSMALANGSRIGISTTTGTAARGQSINLLLLDELAFIEEHLVDEFWKSVYPIVSSSKKSKIFIASTANGTGNLFYKLYTGAETGRNGWGSDKILWNEIPGRDEKWKKETIATIGSMDAFEQEFNCNFLDSGESSVNEELYDRLKNNITDAKYVMEDGHYQIFDEPSDNKIYTVGVDISEGVDKDFSVIQILDITDLTSIKQVAVYANNGISPYHFTEKLYDIYNYDNIVSWGSAAASRKTLQLGIINHSNTKFTGVTNMRYWVNQLEVVQLRDTGTLKELRNFIRNVNGVWNARRGAGFHDDKVMALVWALIILDESLVSKHFEVSKFDNNKRPLILKQLDFGTKYFTSPSSMYNQTEGNSAMPSIIGTMDQSNDDINTLTQQGYKLL